MIMLTLKVKHHDHSGNSKDKSDTNVALRTRKGKIIPRGYNQQEYTKKILISDVSLVLGQRVQARPIWRWHVR